MATGRGTQPTLGAWGLAGVPILVTFVQTTLALLETTLGSAGLGAIQDAIRSVAVFDAAAVLMWRSPTVVFGLFILITAAWLMQGVAQFSRGNRDVTFAAAGLVSVLFFALFLGVYSPLFGMDVPTVQVGAFFAVPFLSAGAAIGAALQYDWDVEVVEEKTAELAEVASELERKREAFDEGYRRRVGDLDAFSEVAPNGVERARERRRAFLDQCDDLEAEIDAAKPKSAEQLRAEAAALRSRVTDLDPETELDRIDDELRERVASGVRTTYGTIKCWSRYDQAYELVNLPGRFREVEIPAFDTEVHIDRVDEALLDRIEQGVSLQTVASGVETVDDHVDRVNEHLAERETSFAEVAEAAESDVGTVETKVERFDGRVADRLGELAVEGRREAFPSVRSVEEQLDEGRTALHDCRFEDAQRAAEDAAADASELVTFVEFLWSLVGTVEHGGERVSLPGSLDASLADEFRAAFEREYGVEFRVADGAVHLTYRETAAGADETGTDSRSSPGSGSSPDAGSSPNSESDADVGTDSESGSDDRTDRARPEEVIDAVLFVFRELKAAGRTGETDRAELQTDDLPENIATPAVLTQIDRFGQRQTDVLERLVVPENAPPGFVELVPKDGTTVERAVDALHERYREQYG